MNHLVGNFYRLHRQLICLGVLIVFIGVGFNLSSGRALLEEPSGAGAILKSDNNPFLTLRVHNAGKIGLTVTNKGQIGTGAFGIDPLDPLTGLPAPSCQYPFPSVKEHLFTGAIWIGAVVGEDTLVSVGVDGWQYIQELWPEAYPQGDMGYDSVLSQQDVTAVYSDTLTDSAYVVSDPTDGRPHMPLNIEITQRSYSWSYPIAEDFVLFDYSIKNIGDEVLDEMYVGIYVDGDVLNGTVMNGHEDDICGFKTSIPSIQGCGFIDTVNIAWIADNDGLEGSPGCPYDTLSLTSVTGVSLIRTPSDSLRMNFNWWRSNGIPSYDWGPRLAGTPENPFRDFGGFLGTPEGDRNKYYIMSHQEFDYDQLFTAVDHSSNGWLPPPANSFDLADGFDTKYLLSFGPFTLPPGQTLPITLSYVAGEDFHYECNAFDSLFEHLNPWAFYDYLDFGSLGKNAIYAAWFYDNPGVDTDSDGYYWKFRICGDDTLYYQGDGIPDFAPYSICGDVNGDGVVNLIDITYLIDYMYGDGPQPMTFKLSDVNNDGYCNILDITRLINFLYMGGAAPEC